MRARILMAVLVLIGAVGLTRADEKPLDRSELDKRVVAIVYETAVRGTDIFNKGAHGECARLYEGTLLAVAPLLDHRPKLQSDVKARLERASKMGKPADAAFELRTALDEVQNTIAPAKKDPKEVKTTLWDRLGGEKGVKALVRTSWILAADDPKGGAFREKKIDASKLELALVSFVSAAAEGPLKYSAADLQTALGGATITDADFDALTTVMVDQLKKAKVADADLAALGKAWEGARKDIVAKPKN